MKLRTDRGAKIAMTMAKPRNDQPTSEVNWPWLARDRTAETTCETGFTFTKACSHPGIVSAGTNAVLANVSGPSRNSEVLRPGGLLALEVGQGQSRAVETLFERSGLRLAETQRDLAGIPRVVRGRR